MYNNHFKKLTVIILLFASAYNFAIAQHCSDKNVPDNGSHAKIRQGGGFTGSYSFPCIVQNKYTELEVPFKVFNTIPHGNADDTVYQMKIEQISNIPEGMCWVTSRENNTFSKGEGGVLVLRGITADNIGQYQLSILVSFDTKGTGQFDRPNLSYNKVSNTGRMILRVTATADQCPEIDYDQQSNIAGSAGLNTAAKQ